LACPRIQGDPSVIYFLHRNVLKSDASEWQFMDAPLGVKDLMVNDQQTY